MIRMRYALVLHIGILLPLHAMEKKPTEITPLNLKGIAKDPTANVRPTSRKSLANILTPRSAAALRNETNNNQCEPCVHFWYYLLCLPLCHCCLNHIDLNETEKK